MNYPVKKDDRNYTYDDYLSWPTDERWELIDGVAYNMTPAPSRVHQKISAALFNEIYNYFKNKPCEAYNAPFDVRLPEETGQEANIHTVVQPDIAVICNPAKLDDKGCNGSPDLIIEIVSPATAALDYIQKMHLYEKHGVREYWIVHPIDQIVMVYLLNGAGQYGKPDIYAKDDQIKVGIFTDLTIDLKLVFNEK